MNDFALPMEVGHLLPQKPPMVMVDTLLECTDTAARTRFLIREDNIFVADGRLREEGLLENIAQTAAAHAAVLGAAEGQAHGAVGFIGAMSRVVIQHLPRANSAIETTLTIMHRIENVAIISGAVMQDEQILASCEMKIFTKA
jgi:predicted hotdog family 3-hydroxylacyl-ACP dehydratase